MIFSRAFVLLGITSLALAPVHAADDTRAWIAKSNAHAQLLVDTLAKTSPEMAGRLGVPGYDEKIADLTAGANERTRALLTAARDELAQRLLLETDPFVRQDLAILVKSATAQIDTSELTQRLALPYGDLPQLIFFGEFSLLDDQIDAARRPAALARLRRYTGLAPGTTPITELAKARYLEKISDPTLLAPFKGQVETHLAAIPRYATGIRKLYEKFGLDQLPGATEALAALDTQFKDYTAWLRDTVLPKARPDFRLPPKLYADNLKNVGLDLPPEELIKKAQLAYAEIRNELKTLAPLVAQARGFTDTDYRAVIRALKKDQIPRDQVEPLYREIITKVEEIIRREKILTLPDRPMRMRIASEAENAAQPAPHYQPPPLIGAKTEQGIFVLTTSSADASGQPIGFDDFTYRAGAWTLTAHEGRPGHDLQFAAMVERGLSLPRSLFARNSVNIEGWALYAEAETKPFLPLDGQLIALQHRLMRAARAFLDPMLNLGLITPARALEILTQEVCLSEGMARQEVDRYTFRMPGQATAYFYGYTRLMQLRTETEIALGTKFERQAFNDFVINQGMLPPDLLAAAVREQFIPAQLRR